MKKRNYDLDHLGSFDEEWGVHKRCREWWYCTGILFDEEGNMYSYQYTLLHMNMGIKTLKIAMAAFTDYKNKRHYYLQIPASKEEPLILDETQAAIGKLVSAKKGARGMDISIHHKDVQLDVFADYGKGAFWHCDNGKLMMGVDKSRQTTMYYSYTNMPTNGTVVLNGKTLKLTGKTWFDKQGGTYNILDWKTQWEWFSIRFFDDEEMMLFTFPQVPGGGYFDGTFISKDGTGGRFNDYTIQQTGYTTFEGSRWSTGWHLSCCKKEKEYFIEPIQEGHMNFAYFEEVCYVKNAKGEIVGYCFAELLPGVLNNPETQKADPSISLGGSNLANLLARVEF